MGSKKISYSLEGSRLDKDKYLAHIFTDVLTLKKKFGYLK
jgi:hypothetical protein